MRTRKPNEAGRRRAAPKAGQAAAVAEGQLGELMPLLAALVKVMNRLAPEVPTSLKEVWQAGSLAPRHMNVLLTLTSAGPMSVTELSARLGVGLPTASLLVAELSRVGLVVRTEDETDRRRTLVDLAPGHRRTVAEFLSRRAGLLRTALEPLEPAQRAALLAGLRAIVGVLEAAADNLPSDSSD